MNDNHKEISDTLELLAQREGLLVVGVCDLETRLAMRRYEQWLDRGMDAGMTYMRRHLEVRREPARLLPGAIRMLVFALPYRFDCGDTESRTDDGGVRSPRIARYAMLADYHRVLKTRCEKVLAVLSGRFPGFGAYRVVVDSVPLLERSFAERAGAGFIGKNTCFILPGHGSFLLLAEVLVSCPLPVSDGLLVDPARRTPTGGCGSCKRCQVHCPTRALDEAWVLDARKCLSYWTIEHRGPIPFKFWPPMGRYFFGCDICQAVCPWNRDTPGLSDESLIKFREVPDLEKVARMTQGEYEQMFGGTSLTRAKRDGLRRNALIALIVTGDHRAAAVLETIAGESGSPLLAATVEQARNWLAGYDDPFPDGIAAESV